MDSYSVESEIEAVKAIFPDVVEVLDSTSRLCVVCAEEVRVYVTLKQKCIPIFEVSAPAMPAKFKTSLVKKLLKISSDHFGEPVIYAIVEAAINFYYEHGRNFGKKEEAVPAAAVKQQVPASPLQSTNSRGTGGTVFSGSILEDRKSIFQAHVASISSKEDAADVLTRLKQNGKIARATHNMFAWRIVVDREGKTVEQHDCECDGEDGAGPKLLRLLTMMNAANIIVIVSRWYGGRHLGPDRFRHICNLARSVILDYQNEMKQ